MKPVVALRLGFLLLLAAAFAAVSAPVSLVRPGQASVKQLPRSPSLFPAIPGPAGIRAVGPSGLCAGQRLTKRTATSELAWKQIGSASYSNDNFAGGPPQWSFNTRDTTEYDANGNIVLVKTTNAHSEWAAESLMYADSFVYTGGRLADVYILTYGAPEYTSHIAFSYLDNGKVLVWTEYKWIKVENVWKPVIKDSIIYAGNAADFMNSDYSNFVGMFSYTFDSVTASWKMDQSYQRISTECTATVLTMAGKTQVTGTTDSLRDVKEVITYNSSVWTNANLAQEVEQWWDPAAKAYFDYSKSVYTYNNAGYQTGSQNFDYDSVTKSMLNSGKSMTFPDAHGLDTLEFYFYFDHGSPFDSTGYRSERIYDAFGNNIQVIDYNYDFSSLTWRTESKRVYVFAQINTPVVSFRPLPSGHGVSMARNNGRVQFSASDLTGLMLYNAAGRLLFSVKQKAGESISLDLASHAAGVYVARLLYKGGEASVKFLLGR